MSGRRKKAEQKLKNDKNALHNLESCYQKLIDLFKDNGVDRIREMVEGEITDPNLFMYIFDQAANLILDIQHREKFENYLKMYRRYLRLVMTDAAAEPYKTPLKTFSHILKMVRSFERGPRPNKRSSTDDNVVMK